MTATELQSELERLKAENARLKAAAKGEKPIRFGVGEKGTICIYGLGRYPVSLYPDQISRLFTPEMVKEVLDFTASKAAECSAKALVHAENEAAKLRQAVR